MGTARTKAVLKRNRKTYDRIEFNVLKGQKKVIEEYVSRKGMTMNKYIRSLIYKDMGIPEPTLEQVKNTDNKDY